LLHHLEEQSEKYTWPTEEEGKREKKKSISRNRRHHFFGTKTGGQSQKPLYKSKNPDGTGDAPKFLKPLCRNQGHKPAKIKDNRNAYTGVTGDTGLQNKKYTTALPLRKVNPQQTGEGGTK